jgi:hypothetical protein
MKLITKLSFITAATAVIATSAAFADDQHLQNRLTLDGAKNTQASRATTVAVYANNRSVGRSETQAVSTESRFELRSNPHGQTFGAFVPANK